MFNFNNKANEYETFGNITDELIKLFGVDVKWIKTKFVDVDSVLGDFKNYQSGTDDIIEWIMLLPSTPEGFEGHNNFLSQFGLINLDSMDFYLSIHELKRIHDEFNKCVGDLIILPSGKVMEVTNISSQVPGINNMFLYPNQKQVYQLTCKTYHYNHDNIKITKEPEIGDTGGLDMLFNLLEKETEKTEQDKQSPAIKGTDPVFGDLG